MSIGTRAADLAYTFRFLKILTTPWEETSAYKLGIIDDKGKRNKSQKLDTSKHKSAYTTFLRLVYNIKRLIQKVPGAGGKLGNLAAGLWLIKENFNMSDKALEKMLSEMGVDPLDLLQEESQWFLLEDKRISPGVYRVSSDKIVNSTYEEVVRAKDPIRISEKCYPIGEVLGLDIYKATHIRSNQEIYITASELIK